MQTANNITAAQHIDNAFAYQAGKHADLIKKVKEADHLSYLLEWNTEEILKQEHILGLAHQWEVIKANETDSEEAPQQLLASLLDDIIDWSPDRSTSPIARLREQARLEALKTATKFVRHAIQAAK